MLRLCYQVLSKSALKMQVAGSEQCNWLFPPCPENVPTPLLSKTVHVRLASGNARNQAARHDITLAYDSGNFRRSTESAFLSKRACSNEGTENSHVVTGTAIQLPNANFGGTGVSFTH